MVGHPKKKHPIQVIHGLALSQIRQALQATGVAIQSKDLLKHSSIVIYIYIDAIVVVIAKLLLLLYCYCYIAIMIIVAPSV